jgi:hypothetical protein
MFKEHQRGSIKMIQVKPSPPLLHFNGLRR